MMKKYQFKKRHHGESWYDRTCIYGVYDNGHLIGNFESDYDVSFFAFDNYSCKIDVIYFLFRKSIRVIDCNTDEIICQNCKNDYCDLIIKNRRYFGKSLPFDSGYRLFKPSTWKSESKLRWAFNCGATEIVYETGIRTRDGLMCRCDGFFVLPDESYLLDAFCGFYFLDQHFEMLDNTVG